MNDWLLRRLQDGNLGLRVSHGFLLSILLKHENSGFEVSYM